MANNPLVSESLLFKQFEKLAQYNSIMNATLIESMSKIAEAELWEDKGAFFGSILGTLNHILVGDLIWLRRFNNHSNHTQGFDTLKVLADFPVSVELDKPLYCTLADYHSQRIKLDNIIIDFIHELNVADLEVILTYTNTKGVEFKKTFGLLLQHFFNHQTHHRGQVTTLLNQKNIDVGCTDLLIVI